jgi:hypothetical protein
MPRYHGTTESIRHPNRFAPRLFRYPASDTRWLAADAMRELGIVNESARENWQNYQFAKEVHLCQDDRQICW